MSLKLWFHICITVNQHFLHQADNESNSTPKKKPDFLDILLTARSDTGEGLNDQELMDEVNTFLFAGMYKLERDSKLVSTLWQVREKIR